MQKALSLIGAAVLVAGVQQHEFAACINADARFTLEQKRIIIGPDWLHYYALLGDIACPGLGDRNGSDH